MSWGPLNTHSPTHTFAPLFLSRIRRELVAILTNPVPGIHVVADEQDITLVHCLIVGPAYTPYEGGFFYFIVRFPPNYPIAPLKVKLMTTGGSTVRFNRNLDRDGTVCLSILGPRSSWEGPGWSPLQSLTSVLISIQSLMNSKPYHNKPGNYIQIFPDGEQDNQLIQHETLRVAVVGMLDNDYSINLPQPLRQIMENYFVNNYQTYTTLIERRFHLNGATLKDRFKCSVCQPLYKCDYKQIRKRIGIIYKRLHGGSDGFWKRISDFISY
ncbi:ubiquitin-conjugating enzyme E2 Z-like [Macrosteles quadrilineatus]|uniref:ubiquitin-conjugating enzyme E2 Z-like n=1 Tax=Macrosteles quadrilineatus TaxID=74068 RepID=UPI0023E126F2|nr:ubiquitin-conjugating enzyme E2 Z-like [Macrosteles quadrilineatus]